MSQERYGNNEAAECMLQGDLLDAISYEGPQNNRAVHSYGPLGTDVDNPPDNVAHLIPADQTESETDRLLGRWPKRLLHVPSMTSFAWSSGNVYGGVTEPRYNAISYTWGRFRLDRKLKTGNKKLLKKYGSVKGITIHGLNWDTPKIYPEHFTEQEFRAVLLAACQPREDIIGGKVDFLWVDIACIHQTDPAENADEVGRQAKIFQNAETAYAWLAKHHTKEMRASLEGFETNLGRLHEMTSGRYVRLYTVDGGETELHPPVLTTPTIHDVALPSDRYQNAHLITSIQRYIPMLEPLAEVSARLHELFFDPWFSSLWTLQESYLCPHAIFLSRSSQRGTLSSTDRSVGDLHGLVTSCNQVAAICNDILADNALYEERKVQRVMQNAAYDDHAGYPPDHWSIRLVNLVVDILGLISASGMSALAVKNPLALLGMAGQRTASRDTDHVYGIQQVFNFRLGQSSRTSSQGVKYTRWILENQLGAELLRQYPVLSQMYVATIKTRFGSNWRINTGSRVPKLHLSSGLHELEFRNLCNLSVTYVEQRWWGSFEGRLCSFKTLSDSWAAMDSRSGIAEPPHQLMPNIPSVCELAMDVDILDAEVVEILGTVIGPGTRDYLSFAGGRALPQDQEYQRKYALWIRYCYKDDDLRVLLLGSFEDFEGKLEKMNLIEAGSTDAVGPPRPTKYHVGLILVKKSQPSEGLENNQHQFWKRVGFCVWKISSRRIDGKVAPKPEVYSPHLRILRAETGCWYKDHGLYG